MSKQARGAQAVEAKAERRAPLLPNAHEEPYGKPLVVLSARTARMQGARALCQALQGEASLGLLALCDADSPTCAPEALRRAACATVEEAAAILRCWQCELRAPRVLCLCAHGRDVQAAHAAGAQALGVYEEAQEPASLLKADALARGMNEAQALCRHFCRTGEVGGAARRS